jgi:uncharacterized membrane protein YoaK (UPF0700 family)
MIESLYFSGSQNRSSLKTLKKTHDTRGNNMMMFILGFLAGAVCAVLYPVVFSTAEKAVDKVKDELK